MKISKNTMDVLKNFSEINQSIVIKEGNEIKTISALKNILSKATVEENFPKDFAIYDLPSFIGFESTMSECEFEFKDDCMMMVEGSGGKGKYFYAEPSLVVTPPDKEIEMPESDIKFELKADDFESIMKKSTILKLADVCLKSCTKSNSMYLYTTNKNNDTSNDYSIKVAEGVVKKFNVVFKKENLKIIPGDYDVTISNGISHFVNKNNKYKLEYWIATEASSDYGE